MKQRQPQKRHPSLQPLSREHHQGLLLSWKIRTGLTKSIEPNRIRSYTSWFFDTYLIPHFRMEEEYIFPVLGRRNELVIQALEEHQRLTYLFTTTEEDDVNVLSQIENELDEHIRFEERIMFPEIQKVASKEQLLQIEKKHRFIPFKENTMDEFWK